MIDHMIDDITDHIIDHMIDHKWIRQEKIVPTLGSDHRSRTAQMQQMSDHSCSDATDVGSQLVQMQQMENHSRFRCSRCKITVGSDAKDVT